MDPPGRIAVFARETLGQGLRQLVLSGRVGLPVIADDAQTVVGWITNLYLSRENRVSTGLAVVVKAS